MIPPDCEALTLQPGGKIHFGSDTELLACGLRLVDAERYSAAVTPVGDPMEESTPYHSSATDHQFPSLRDYSTVWLVRHEREDAMCLLQHEYTAEEAIATLKHILSEHAQRGLHVTPSTVNQTVGQRYDVSDAGGWYATYWLSPERIAANDGALTAVITPVARQHDFVR
jgi:hypothetical protein